MCILTTRPDRSGLEDAITIEFLPLLEALKHYVRKRRTNASSHAFAKLIMKLTDLRSISIKGSQRLPVLFTAYSQYLIYLNISNLILFICKYM